MCICEYAFLQIHINYRNNMHFWQIYILSSKYYFPNMYLLISVWVTIMCILNNVYWWICIIENMHYWEYALLWHRQFRVMTLTESASYSIAASEYALFLQICIIILFYEVSEPWLSLLKSHTKNWNWEKFWPGKIALWNRLDTRYFRYVHKKFK